MHISGGENSFGPQKFHTTIVPRIGGVCIFLGFIASVCFQYFFSNLDSIVIILALCSIPIFTTGLIEDLTGKIGPMKRLIYMAAGILLSVYFLPAQIAKVGITSVDLLLSIQIISIIFSVFAITGLSNAYNIIDGFNGLSSMVGVTTLLGLTFISYLMGDSMLIKLGLACIASILGFIAWNYPKGLIFMGDGGAYLVGFWVAIISVLLIERHSEISPWFALLINGYPVSETIYTIYRRKIIEKINPGNPDALHFHSLIFKYLHKSGKGSIASLIIAPLMLALSLVAIIPAILFYRSSSITASLFIVYFGIYIYAYKEIYKAQLK